jgi:hypothetical protein
MLQKQSVPINFSQGLDTKTDSKQVAVGKFLNLQNSVFDKGGLLQKRNGYGQLSSSGLDETSTYLTTLNGNLTAVGDSVSAYVSGTETWVSKGMFQPMEVDTLPLIKNNLNQIQCDSVVASNGLVCTVYSEINASTVVYKYVIADSTTGQNIVEPTLLVADPTFGTPRVFILGFKFIIVYTTHPSSYQLEMIAISYANTAIVVGPITIVNAYNPSTTLSWDGLVFNDTLYVAFDTSSGGQAVKVISVGNNLALTGFSHTFAGSIATMMTLAVDSTINNPVIYISWYDSASSTGFDAVVNSNLALVRAPVEIISSGSFLNLTSAAQNGSVRIFGEVNNNYGYDSSIPTHYIDAVDVSQAGVVGTPFVVVRSVGLASKAFIVDGIIYVWSAYQSEFQNTYFLINGTLSTEASPSVAGKLAYENGGGYLTHGLPIVTVTNGNVAQFAYLYKDLIEALATLSNSQQTTAGGVYSQTGINLGTVIIGTQGIDSAEIANDLHLSGGFFWMYDGYLPVEHNFFLWPDNVEATWSDTGGSMVANPPGWVSGQPSYYYQVVYSWSDNQGNQFRSAASIPVTITRPSDASATGSVTLNIPTLRLTYKVENPVKIEVYRWSVDEQVYYQVSSSATQPNPILAPLLNNTTIDYVTFVDTYASASIVGNNIIYTNGGVVEDVNAPASNIMTLFDTRLWLVDSEDKNLLWFSKQVIENVPVEMSDLFTVYIAPNTGTVGSTGPITALAPMDDKLIIFKENAMYYINGSGPDNTGANNQYSQPIFVASTVGCTNQASIVLMPQGLMFQSDKGIWLLGRDLTTNYIGAPVEAFNSSTVQSAVNVPDTNQVRFTLSTGQTLMYDYYYEQWGTFVGVPAISSCIFQDLHTFLNVFGNVYQETPGAYIDGSNPVLLSFTTSWLNFMGLQGYQLGYWFLIIGQYITPQKLQVSVAYDYNASPSQSNLITPSNFNSSIPSPYGVPSAPFGANSDLYQWRVFLTKKRCQAFQVTIQEVYDPSFGVPPGEGLTLSGINFIAGFKSKFRPMPAAQSIGGSR